MNKMLIGDINSQVVLYKVDEPIIIYTCSINMIREKIVIIKHNMKCQSIENFIITFKLFDNIHLLV